MQRIAMVDDDRGSVQELSETLARYAVKNQREFESELFSNGEDFLKADADKNYDIVFLDIDMPGNSGMEIAKKLRANDRKIIIIFCTNLQQYAIEGYSVGAMGYLLKPVNDYTLGLVMDKACAYLARAQFDRLYIKTVHGQELIYIRDLVYVEVQRHNLFFYVSDKHGGLYHIRTRGTIQEISRNLEKAFFARCSVCYLVNLSHVLSIENNTVKLTGAELLISRTCKKNFMESFMQYLLRCGVPNIREGR